MIVGRKNGFGLIETVTAIAVTGVVVLAASQVASYVNNQVQRTVKLNDLLQAQQVVQEKVSFSDLCDAALGPGTYPGSAAAAGPNPNPVTLPTPPPANDWGSTAGREIQVYSPGIQSGIAMNLNTISSNPVNADNVLPLLGVKIYSLRIQEGFQVGAAGSGITPLVPAGETQWIAKLVMQAGPLPNGPALTSTGVVELPPPVVLSTITLNLNAAGQVVDCRGGVTQSSSEVCADFGCTYDPSKNPACTCPSYARGCGGINEIPVGVDNSGTFICVPPANGNCPANQYMSGIQNGGIVCSSYNPLSSSSSLTVTCPATATWSWTQGGFTCSGSYSETTATSGTTTPSISNSAGGLSGSAIFTCSGAGSWQPAAGATCAPSGSTCPGGVMMAWTDPTTGDPCSGATISTVAGNIDTVFDSSQAPYLTGSAQFMCNAGGTWSVSPTNQSCKCSSGWGYNAWTVCPRRAGFGEDQSWNPGFATKADCVAMGRAHCMVAPGCMCSP